MKSLHHNLNQQHQTVQNTRSLWELNCYLSNAKACPFYNHSLLYYSWHHTKVHREQDWTGNYTYVSAEVLLAVTHSTPFVQKMTCTFKQHSSSYLNVFYTGTAHWCDANHLKIPPCIKQRYTLGWYLRTWVSIMSLLIHTKKERTLLSSTGFTILLIIAMK